MPKYRNKSDQFTQPIPLNGGRVLVKPGEVVELPNKLNLEFFNFLEEVAASTPAKVAEVQKLPPAVAPKPPTPPPEVVPPKPVDTVVQDIKMLKDTLAVVVKRLEIMKGVMSNLTTAIQNLEGVVYQNPTPEQKKTDE